MLNQTRALECREFLTYLETARPCAAINLIHVFAIILVVQHKTRDILTAKRSVDAIYAYNGLHVYSPAYRTLVLAFEQQAKTQLGFDDCLVLATMQEFKITHLVTFDIHFKNVAEIQILSPKEALDFLTSGPSSP